MASKGGVGLDIDCARVPLREAGMEPFEIMVSESQERMLCVVEPSRVDEVIAVCEKWETLATPIGSVTDPGGCGSSSAATVVADLPVGILVDDCPLYDLEPEPAQRRRSMSRRPALLSGDGAGRRDAAGAAGSANLASRRPVFEQYDPVVQSRTVRRPDDADAAVLVLAPRTERRDRGGDRRQRAPGGVRPARGRHRGGLRVRGQPRLRGGRRRSG